jgi:hypothetical protein
LEVQLAIYASLRTTTSATSGGTKRTKHATTGNLSGHALCALARIGPQIDARFAFGTVEHLIQTSRLNTLHLETIPASYESHS